MRWGSATIACVSFLAFLLPTILAPEYALEADAIVVAQTGGGSGSTSTGGSGGSTSTGSSGGSTSSTGSSGGGTTSASSSGSSGGSSSSGGSGASGGSSSSGGSSGASGGSSSSSSSTSASSGASGGASGLDPNPPDVAFLPGSAGYGSGGYAGASGDWGAAWAGFFWGLGAMFAAIGMMMILFAEALILLFTALFASLAAALATIAAAICAAILLMVLGMIGGLLVSGGVLAAVWVHHGGAPWR